MFDPKILISFDPRPRVEHASTDSEQGTFWGELHIRSTCKMEFDIFHAKHVPVVPATKEHSLTLMSWTKNLHKINNEPSVRTLSTSYSVDKSSIAFNRLPEENLGLFTFTQFVEFSVVNLSKLYRPSVSLIFDLNPSNLSNFSGRFTSPLSRMTQKQWELNFTWNHR